MIPVTVLVWNNIMIIFDIFFAQSGLGAHLLRITSWGSDDELKLGKYNWISFHPYIIHHSWVLTAVQSLDLIHFYLKYSYLHWIPIQLQMLHHCQGLWLLVEILVLWMGQPPFWLHRYTLFWGIVPHFFMCSVLATWGTWNIYADSWYIHLEYDLLNRWPGCSRFIWLDGFFWWPELFSS